jgi:hypothetical protein
MQPLARVAGVSALSESGPPHPGTAGHLYRSGVSPPRRILRLRAHGPLPPGRPIVRVQWRPLLPTPSPCQASQRVAVVAAQPGRLCLVNAARAQLPDRARSLPGLTGGATRLSASARSPGNLGALARQARRAHRATLVRSPGQARRARPADSVRSPGRLGALARQTRCARPAGLVRSLGSVPYEFRRGCLVSGGRYCCAHRRPDSSRMRPRVRQACAGRSAS